VARDLQTGVRQFERPPAVAAAGVLGADQLLEDIEVRALEPRAEAEADILRELADLRDDPAQDVAGEASTKASGRSRERSNYAAPAGKDTMCCEGFGTLLVVIAAFSTRWVAWKEEEEERVEERGKRVKETQRGALATRNPKMVVV
jgi:hypothetical protein